MACVVAASRALNGLCYTATDPGCRCVDPAGDTARQRTIATALKLVDRFDLTGAPQPANRHLTVQQGDITMTSTCRPGSQPAHSSRGSIIIASSQRYTGAQRTAMRAVVCHVALAGVDIDYEHLPTKTSAGLPHGQSSDVYNETQCLYQQARPSHLDNYRSSPCRRVLKVQDARELPPTIMCSVHPLSEQSCTHLLKAGTLSHRISWPPAAVQNLPQGALGRAS